MAMLPNHQITFIFDRDTIAPRQDPVKGHAGIIHKGPPELPPGAVIIGAMHPHPNPKPREPNQTGPSEIDMRGQDAGTPGRPIRGAGVPLLDIPWIIVTRRYGVTMIDHGRRQTIHPYPLPPPLDPPRQQVERPSSPAGRRRNLLSGSFDERHERGDGCSELLVIVRGIIEERLQVHCLLQDP